MPQKQQTLSFVILQEKNARDHQGNYNGAICVKDYRYSLSKKR
jgi:hypothetical protein